MDREDQERHQFGVPLEMPGRERVEHADRQAADDRARDAAEPAEDRRREALDAQRAAHRRADVEQRADQPAGQRGRGRRRSRTRWRCCARRGCRRRWPPRGPSRPPASPRRAWCAAGTASAATIATAAMASTTRSYGADPQAERGPAARPAPASGTARPVAPQIDDGQRLQHDAEADRADQHQVEVLVLQRPQHPLDDQADQRRSPRWRPASPPRTAACRTGRRWTRRTRRSSPRCRARS